MRPGLATSDEVEADKMVGDMNELLSDPKWWNAARRQEAEFRFSKTIVDAFYDELQQEGMTRTRFVRRAFTCRIGRKVIQGCCL